MMSVSGNEGELDALVDSILQSRDRSANTSQTTHPLLYQQQHQTRPASPPQRVPSTGNTALHTSHGAAAPASHHAPASAGRYADTNRNTAVSERSAEEDEEDLNALVQRILTGPPTDAAAARDRAPPSASTTSSPRLFAQARHGGTTAPPPPPVAHLGHPAGGAQRGGGGGVRASSGAVRVDPAHAHSLSARMSEASATHRMRAVVRRLALWQERKEAKRVQAVYEALEREQLDCTFEPSINYATEPDASPHHHGSGSRPVRAATISMSSSSATTTSSSDTSASSSARAPGGPYIPALEPPAQPILGADAFVDRLRRAQEEREAAQAAEEARRLQYYDRTTFQRDPTVPAPFTLGDMRPRRVATATAAVAGVPAPLRRSAGRDGLGSAMMRQSPSQHRGTAYRAGGPAYADGDGVGEAWAEGEEEEAEEKRLTALNTFLTLAPHIRQTLLFDSRMDQQLHRATASIHRAEEEGA